MKGSSSHGKMAILVVAPGVLVKRVSLQVRHARGRLSSVDGEACHTALRKYLTKAIAGFYCGSQIEGQPIKAEAWHSELGGS